MFIMSLFVCFLSSFCFYFLHKNRFLSLWMFSTFISTYQSRALILGASFIVLHKSLPLRSKVTYFFSFSHPCCFLSETTPLETSSLPLLCLGCTFNTPDKAGVCFCVWLKQPAGGETSSNLQYLQPFYIKKKSLHVLLLDVQNLWHKARINCVLAGHFESLFASKSFFYLCNIYSFAAQEMGRLNDGTATISLDDAHVLQ